MLITGTIGRLHHGDTTAWDGVPLTSPLCSPAMTTTNMRTSSSCHGSSARVAATCFLSRAWVPLLAFVAKVADLVRAKRMLALMVNQMIDCS